MKIFLLPVITFCCVNIILAQGPATTSSYTFPDTVTTAILVPANDSTHISATFTPDSTLGFISLDSSGDVVFTHTSFSCGIDTFKYMLCDSGLCDTALAIVTVTCPNNIFLPQGFSPNGDGINDVLVFTGLEYFEPASLKVFNRYGTVVFIDNDYQNNWDGTDNDDHKPLPDGTYFYVLQLSNGHTYNNYLVINR